jgi:glutamine amidotransferase-like uncharacterized protein
MKHVFRSEDRLEVNKITAGCIKSGILFRNGRPYPDMLCMGGGFDLGYLKALGDIGCENICKYVESGGNYLGICAGAYFAASYIEFDLNGELEVKGERKLRFFKGKCLGPLNEKFKYNCEDEVISVELSIDRSHVEIEPESPQIYYLNGGCAFLGEVEDFKDCIVLARYKTIMPDEAAIIKCYYGMGKCLLSGVHFEYHRDDLNLTNDNIRNNVYAKLSETEENKFFLVASLLKNIFSDTQKNNST